MPGGAEMAAKKKTDAEGLAAATAERLERMILDGEVAPGTRLVVRPLAEQLGLSPTPVKMALATLARSGLVTSSYQSGYSVPRPDAKAFEEASQLLCEFDCLAARIVLGSRDSAKRVAKVTAHEEHYRYELNFHQRLWGASRQTQLIEVGNLMRGRAMVASAQLLRSPDATQDTAQEHALIGAALRQGDLDGTLEALQQHARATTETVLALMASKYQRRSKP